MLDPALRATRSLLPLLVLGAALAYAGCSASGTDTPPGGAGGESAAATTTSSSGLGGAGGAGGQSSTAAQGGASTTSTTTTSTSGGGSTASAGGSGDGGSGGAACGAPTALDTTFGNGGEKQLAVVGVPGAFGSDSDRDYGRAIAVESGGNIVFAGVWYSGQSYDFALMRLASDGSLDPSFGTAGIVKQHAFAAPAPLRGVALDGAGNIVVAGALTSFGGPYGLARFTPQGTPDTSFGGTGFISTVVIHPQADSVTAFQPMGVQSDGKVIVGGGESSATSDFVVARYDTSGQLDPSFGVGGTRKLAISAGYDMITTLRVMPDDRIVVAGVGNKNMLPWEAGEFAVAVLDADGTPDAGFNGVGFATAPVDPEGGRPNGVTMQPDGKVVATGCLSCDYNFASKVDTVVVRFLSTGALDPSFSGDGIRTLKLDPLIDIGYDVVVAPNGNLVVSGGLGVQQQSGTMYVARLLPDGALDPCFGTAGVFSTYPVQGFAGNDQAFSVKLLGDGSILAAGCTGDSTLGDFAILKLAP